MAQSRRYAGLQDAYLKNHSLIVWVVHSGDVASVVPEPASSLLALGGLLLVGAMVRRRTG